jgi:hydrogenase nickel incorporation protein HypA/HybF
LHELALMQSVAELAQAEARQRGAEAITAIRLRVGSLAGVDPEALRFAAEVVLAEGLSAGARLEIETVPARAWCRPCTALFTLEQGLCRCPRCGTVSAELRQGRELELASLELRLPATAEPGDDGPAGSP